MELIIVIIFWIIGICLNGMIASEKNRNRGEAIVNSILFSPLVVYLYLLAVPAKEKQKKIVYVRNDAENLSYAAPKSSNIYANNKPKEYLKEDEGGLSIVISCMLFVVVLCCIVVIVEGCNLLNLR